MKFLVGFILSLTLFSGVVHYVDHVYASEQVQLQVTEAPATQVVVASVQEDMPKLCQDEQGQAKVCDNADLVGALVKSMGGFKGASALAIAFIIAKILLLFILSPFAVSVLPFLAKGMWRLTVAYGVNLVVGVLGLMVADAHVTFGIALVHANTLALASVFANQAFKQYLTSKGKT